MASAPWAAGGKTFVRRDRRLITAPAQRGRRLLATGTTEIFFQRPLYRLREGGSFKNFSGYSNRMQFA